jgi:hypothetical protein
VGGAPVVTVEDDGVALEVEVGGLDAGLVGVRADDDRVFELLSVAERLIVPLLL